MDKTTLNGRSIWDAAALSPCCAIVTPLTAFCRFDIAGYYAGCRQVFGT